MKLPEGPWGTRGHMPALVGQRSPRVPARCPQAGMPARCQQVSSSSREIGQCWFFSVTTVYFKHCVGRAHTSADCLRCPFAASVPPADASKTDSPVFHSFVALPVGFPVRMLCFPCHWPWTSSLLRKVLSSALLSPSSPTSWPWDAAIHL